MAKSLKMSESSRAEDDNERKTGEKKDNRKKEEELDIEGKVPGTPIYDGKGVSFSY